MCWEKLNRRLMSKCPICPRLCHRAGSWSSGAGSVGLSRMNLQNHALRETHGICTRGPRKVCSESSEVWPGGWAINREGQREQESAWKAPVAALVILTV